MKRRKSVVLGCVMLAVVCSLGMVLHNAAASSATGYLAIGNGRIEFTYAYAIVKPNPYNETRENVVVILTDHPFSDEAVENEWTRKELVEEKGIRYVEIDIASNESSQWVQMFGMWLDPSGSSYQGASGLGTLELKVFDETQVEGRYYTDGEEKGVVFDLTFQAEIRRTENAPRPPESTEEPEAETTADSAEIDEELAALSPQEKFERTIADMRKLGTAFGSHLVDLDYYPICPSEKDVSEVELGKSEWAAPSWDDFEVNFKDAWGMPFKYVSTDDGKSYTLTSYGADKTKGDGGGEFDADIVYRDGTFVAPANFVNQ